MTGSAAARRTASGVASESGHPARGLGSNGRTRRRRQRPAAVRRIRHCPSGSVSLHPNDRRRAPHHFTLFPPRRCSARAERPAARPAAGVNRGDMNYDIGASVKAAAAVANRRNLYLRTTPTGTGGPARQRVGPVGGNMCARACARRPCLSAQHFATAFEKALIICEYSCIISSNSHALCNSTRTSRAARPIAARRSSVRGGAARPSPWRPCQGAAVLGHH